jgi:type VI protein secretion system component Hcp
VEHAEIYLDLTSVGIHGDAIPEEYKNHIELWDWRWGLDLDVANNDRPPHGVGTQVVFTKPVDRATTAMLKYLERGPEIPKGALVLVQRTEQNLMVRLEFEGISFTSCKLKVDSNDKEVELSEDWSMSYSMIKVQYKGRGEKGNDVRGKVQSLGSPSFWLKVPKNAEQKTPEPLSLAEPTIDMADYKDEVTDIVQETLRKQGPQFSKDDILKLIDEYMRKNKLVK